MTDGTCYAGLLGSTNWASFAVLGDAEDWRVGERTDISKQRAVDVENSTPGSTGASESLLVRA